MASGIAGNLVNCTWRFLIAGVFFKFICQRNSNVYWFYYSELPFHWRLVIYSKKYLFL